MKLSFDLPLYLDRVGLDGVEATPRGLAALQAAQMLSITFENIDPLLGVVPDLAPAAIWRKLVEEGRGGYCFELNQLFGSALSAGGFEARRVLARVRNGATEGGARTHLAWLVACGGRTWLADAGFGGPGTVQPLDVADGDAQETPSGTYRFRRDEDSAEQVLEKHVAGEWYALFGFETQPVRDIDIEAGNVFCARWEKSVFVSHLMVSRHTENGRVSLFDRKFGRETGGDTERRELADARDLRACLEDEFMIACDKSRAEALWARLPAT